MSGSKIVVKKAAPNWPACVEKRSSADKVRQGGSEKAHSITSAAASLWMQSRQMKNDIDHGQSQSTKTMTRFASKNSLVRQCVHCQVLYTNFHKCTADA